MQALLEAFRAALASLLANRLRSVLTTLGIVIGTGSVIGELLSAATVMSISPIASHAMVKGAAGQPPPAGRGRSALVYPEPVDIFAERVADLVGREPVLARHARHLQARVRR